MARGGVASRRTWRQPPAGAAEPGPAAPAEAAASGAAGSPGPPPADGGHPESVAAGAGAPGEKAAEARVTGGTVDIAVESPAVESR